MTDRPANLRQAFPKGRRIATADGAMLADPAALGNQQSLAPGVIASRAVAPGATSDATAPDAAAPGAAAPGAAALDAAAPGAPQDAELSRYFEPEFWAQRGQLAEVSRGRGAAWFIAPAARWVLRHYRRGGLVARLLKDRYVWGGERRVRAFAEWLLLAALTQRGLAVPKPVAARYRRAGIFYRCDLITQRIEGAEPLSSLLARGAIPEDTWRNVGSAVARLHAAGVDHADLNAHNILLDGRGTVSIIDFDRGKFRQAGTWAADNVSRLRRSLVKIARELPPDRFSAAAWEWLLTGYAAEATPPPERAG